jgi:hypothetical protein
MSGCYLNLQELAEFLGRGITKNALAKRIKQAHGRAWLVAFGQKIPLVKDGTGRTARWYAKRADLESHELPASVVPIPAVAHRRGRPPKTDFSDGD